MLAVGKGLGVLYGRDGGKEGFDGKEKLRGSGVLGGVGEVKGEDGRW